VWAWLLGCGCLGFTIAAARTLLAPDRGLSRGPALGRLAQGFTQGLRAPALAAAWFGVAGCIAAVLCVRFGRHIPFPWHAAPIRADMIFVIMLSAFAVSALLLYGGTNGSRFVATFALPLGFLAALLVSAGHRPPAAGAGTAVPAPWDLTAPGVLAGAAAAAAMIGRQRTPARGVPGRNGSILLAFLLLAVGAGYTLGVVGMEQDVRQHPSDPGAWVSLAARLERLGRPADAAACIAVARLISPNDRRLVRRACDFEGAAAFLEKMQSNVRAGGRQWNDEWVGRLADTARVGLREPEAAHRLYLLARSIDPNDAEWHRKSRLHR
jgi:hypothetical protein